MNIKQILNDLIDLGLLKDADREAALNCFNKQIELEEMEKRLKKMEEDIEYLKICPNFRSGNPGWG